MEVPLRGTSQGPWSPHASWPRLRTGPGLNRLRLPGRRVAAQGDRTRCARTTPAPDGPDQQLRGEPPIAIPPRGSRTAGPPTQGSTARPTNENHCGFVHLILKATGRDNEPDKVAGRSRLWWLHGPTMTFSDSRLTQISERLPRLCRPPLEGASALSTLRHRADLPAQPTPQWGRIGGQRRRLARNGIVHQPWPEGSDVPWRWKSALSVNRGPWSSVSVPGWLNYQHAAGLPYFSCEAGPRTA
jgi:hypothetical protein